MESHSICISLPLTQTLIAYNLIITNSIFFYTNFILISKIDSLKIFHKHINTLQIILYIIILYSKYYFKLSKIFTSNNFKVNNISLEVIYIILYIVLFHKYA